MNSFQIYRPLHPPTGVEHAASAHFTSASAWNLVLARTSLLEVYDVRESAQGRVLDLAAQFPLHGNIESIHVLRFPSAPLDALMLSFREAKIAVVVYNAVEARLRTLFIHDFEPGSPGAGVKAKAGITEQVNGLMDVQIVRVEPQSQCAVMMLCDTHLAVIPFRRGRDVAGGMAAATSSAAAVAAAADSAEGDGWSATTAAAGVSGSVPPRAFGSAAEAATLNLGVTHEPFVLSLEDLGLRGFVKDIVFLGGFYEPTLLFLHEIERTCTGRLSRRANTCALTAISLRPSDKTHTKIWGCVGLPADSCALYAVPAAVGGAVVVSANALVYVNNATRCALALNDYARVTLDCARIGARRFFGGDESTITLDGSRCAFLADDQLLVSTRTGQLFLASLRMGGGHQVKELGLTKLGSSVLSSCVCVLPELNLFLLGSRLGDSQLIAYEPRHEVPNSSAASSVEDAHGRAMKRRKVESSGVAGSVGGDDDDDVEAELYGGSDAAVSQSQHIREQEAATNEKDKGKDGEEGLGLDDDDDDLYGDSKVEDDAKDKLALAARASAITGTHGKLGEAAYRLRPCFSLFNMGPISDMAIGESAPVEDEDDDEAEKPETDIARPPKRRELVACSGHGKNAAISVIQRGIRFEVIVDVELGSCSALWTVKSHPDVAASTAIADSADENATDGFIIVGTKESTRVLSTEDEGLDEWDSTSEQRNDFVLDGPTLAAGNVAQCRRIVQVFPKGIRLLETFVDSGKSGVRCTQEVYNDDTLDVGGLQVTLGVHICAVDICDPYILLRLSDGTLRLAQLDEGNLKLVTSDVRVEGGVVASCLFKDKAGMLECLWHDHAPQPSSSATSRQPTSPQKGDDRVADDDMDDDADLYGTSTAEATAPPPSAHTSPDPSPVTAAPAVERTYCVLCRDSGTVEFYSMPNFEKCFSAPRLSAGPSALCSTLHSGASASQSARVASNQQSGTPGVLEVALHRVGPVAEGSAPFRRCVLSVFCDTGDVYVYQLRQPDQAPPCFSRMPLGVVTHHRHLATEQRHRRKNRFRYPRLIRYDNVAGRSGIFFCGSDQPLWIQCESGRLLASPMCMDESVRRVGKESKRPVVCFTPFHNALCDEGYVFFHQSGIMRICQQSTSTINSLGGPMTVTKHKMGTTVHKIVYLGRVGDGGLLEALQMPTYAMVVAVPEVAPTSDTPPPADEYGNTGMDERGPQIFGPDDALAPDIPFETHEVRLVQSGKWETVFRVAMQPQEQVLSLAVVNLPDKGSNARDRCPRPYLVVGTGTSKFEGEDAQAFGRVLLYALDYGQYNLADGGKTRKTPKLTQVHEKLQKGHVSNVAQLLDFLIISIGPKLMTYLWMDGSLEPCGFFDLSFYPVSLSTVRNLVLVGDVYKSVQFLRWKRDDKNLVFVGRDDNSLPVLTSDFVMDEKALNFLVADDFKNLFMFHYAPKRIESRDGKKLICCGDFHLGAHVTKMVRQRLTVLEPLDGSRPAEHRYATIFGSLDGGLGMMVPVDEKVFRRLFMLQQILVNALEHNAALNPKGFRMTKLPKSVRPYHNAKNIADGDLLWRFLYLDIALQKELARAIGSTPDVIIQNLLEVDLTSALF